jgi:hypothetical protein
MRWITSACASLLLAYATATTSFAQPAPPDAGVPEPDAAPADAAPPPPQPAPVATPPTPPPPPPDSAFAAAAAASEAAAEVIHIEDTAPAESASSVHLDSRDLGYRSRTQVSDILRQVPGLMVSQHAGGGKSDQYFIRGFDADHGTDLAIYADGVPVNLPSNGHGQGYGDTHFLIPETIDSVDVHKGPYSARFGDFYTAGAMELKTIDQIEGPTVWVAGGTSLDGPEALTQYNRRIVGMASPEIRDNDTDRSLIAAEIGDTQGPFQHAQDFRQGNALVKWQGQAGKGDLDIETMWYASGWNASGQIPSQAIADGLVGRFGSLDPSEGGDTSRTSLQLGYTVRDDHGGTWRAKAFGVGYRLRLYSDFTIFARDPAHGDEIEQDDARTYYGLDLAYDKRLTLLDMDSLFTVGAQMRDDDVETGLWHVQDRRRLGDCFAQGANPCNHDFDRIRDVAAYAEANIHLFPHVHVLPGVRFEQFVWDVDDLSPATTTDPTLTTGGSSQKGIALPKLSVEVEATSKLDVYANAGEGFHSNDARSAIANAGAGALARATGGELGVRSTMIPHARFSVDLWYLHLDSELVWDGDTGGTDAAGATRRYGVDLEGAWQILPWLYFDANASLAHSEFVDNAGNGNALALAPKIMGQGGLRVVRGNSFIALRGRGIGDRPGNDTNTLTAEGYFIFDLIAGTKLDKLGLNLTVNNLLDSDWREAQFADTVAIAPGATPVEQMCFTPGIPLTVTGTATYTF